MVGYNNSQQSSSTGNLANALIYTLSFDLHNNLKHYIRQHYIPFSNEKQTPGAGEELTQEQTLIAEPRALPPPNSGAEVVLLTSHLLRPSCLAKPLIIKRMKVAPIHSLWNGKIQQIEMY